MALHPDVLTRLSDPRTSVAIVTAPAGYGKTSHVAAWVAGQRRRCAWIDLAERHNDAAVFVVDLVAALEEVTDVDPTGVPRTGGTSLQMAIEGALAVGRAVRGCRQPFILVIDDVHLVAQQMAVDVLGAVVANVPSGSTVVVVGRACDLPILNRLRADLGVLEITTEDLALTPSEIAQVLAQFGVAGWTDAELEHLAAVTEGWPVGVRLAAKEALARAAHEGAASTDLSGRQPQVRAYLDAEWLWGLSEDDRWFITQVSVLGPMTGALCNAVLERVDSGDVLRRICEHRLLVIPLDQDGEWYRMHGLLREALTDELTRHDESRVRELHRRASRWCDQAADADEAIRHAIAAGDLDCAEDLVIRHSAEYHTQGRYSTIARWVDAIGRDHAVSSPGLCYAAATASLGLGDAAALRLWLHLAEQALVDRPSYNDVSSLVKLLRSTTNIGPVRPALQLAESARRALPPGIWHAGAHMVHGVWAWTLGDSGAARSLEDGAQESRLFSAPTMEANCEAILSGIACADGDVARAVSHALRASDRLTSSGLRPAPALVVVTAASAWAMAISGDPDAARASWNLARSHLANWKDLFGWANVQSRIALARTSVLLGDRIGADTMVREAHEFLRAQPDAEGARRQLVDVEEHVRHMRLHSGLGPSSLTTAELRVLQFLPTNLSLAEIAGRLYVSRYTVKTHCESIYRKLGASGRSEAVDLAREIGLVQAGV